MSVQTSPERILAFRAHSNWLPIPCPVGFHKDDLVGEYVLASRNEELVDRVRKEYEWWLEQVVGSHDGDDLRQAELLRGVLSHLEPKP